MIQVVEILNKLKCWQWNGYDNILLRNNKHTPVFLSNVIILLLCGNLKINKIIKLMRKPHRYYISLSRTVETFSTWCACPLNLHQPTLFMGWFYARPTFRNTSNSSCPLITFIERCFFFHVNAYFFSADEETS